MAVTNLTVKLVRSSNGEIDDAASTAAFQAELAQYKANRELEESTISDAVHAVFDQYPDAVMTMPVIRTFSLQKLNAQPANAEILGEKVLEFVRENADRPAQKDKKTKAILVPAEPPRTRTFAIVKGARGGVRRWSDVPETEELDTDE